MVCWSRVSALEVRISMFVFCEAGYLTAHFDDVKFPAKAKALSGVLDALNTPI